MSVATTTTSLTSQIAAAIQQRIDLSKDPVRKEALESFVHLGLPAPKNEEYKYAPIARMLEKNFTFGPTGAPGPMQNVKSFFLNGIDAYSMVFIDGAFAREYSTLPSQNGVTALPLEEALASKNAVALQHFNRYIDPRQNAFAAWNTAAWSHGLFLHLSAGTVLDKPLIIYHLANGTAGEIVAVNRNLFVVDRNAEATVIETFHSAGDANHFLNLVNEASVDENAGFNLFSIQNDDRQRFQHEITEVYQKNNSRVNTYTFSVEGKLYRNNLHLSLDGEGIESHMYGLYLLGKDTLADNHTVVDHKKPHSYSNELYKGIMDDSSRGVFNGKIFVRPHAQKTNAFQANRNILLTDKAVVNTKPQLEIWADDVKCSHGCTTGQLDEEAVFYLRSRGISKDSARAMMLYAFAGEVLDQVRHEGLRHHIDNIISQKLHKNF